jgi:hypothetical protein
MRQVTKIRANAIARLLLWLFAAMCILCLDSQAQTSTATLQGVVRDPSRAVIPDAQITVRNVKTGISVDTKTNTEGRFVVPFLQPGDYEVAVEKPGFSRVIHTDIKLSVQQNLALDLQLTVGQVAATVEVSAAPPALEASTQTVQTSVDSKSVTDLPLNTRLVQALALTTPGVQSAGGAAGTQPDKYTPAIGGGRGMTSELLVDGAPLSVADPTGGARSFGGEPPSVDAVQEFTVQVNTLSAEYGRSGGGLISLATKQGTNDLHGTVREFFRNSKMDANDFFSNRAKVPKPGYQRHQYGFSAGGPVYIPNVYNGRNRTFFFVDLERLAQGTAATFTSTMPLDKWRTGDFSGLQTPGGQPITIYDPLTTHPNGSGGFTRDPFPNNIIPANRIDPVAANIMQFFPEPNTASVNPFTPVNNFFKSGKNTLDLSNLTLRFDHNFTDAWRAYWRFNRGVQSSGFPNFYGNIAGPTFKTFASHQYNFVWDNIVSLSPRTILNFRYDFSRYEIQVIPLSAGFDPTTLGFPAYLGNQSKLYGEWTHFPGTYVFANGFTSAGGGGGGKSYPYTHVLEASITKIVSKHTIKAGWDYRKFFLNHYQAYWGGPSGSFIFWPDWTQSNPFAGSPTEGFGWASFLLGIPSNIFQPYFSALWNTPAQAMASSYWAGYVQDDFHVTPKLTLNLGLRYEVNTPRTERYNRMSYYDLNAPSPIAGLVPGFPNLVGAMRFVDSHHRQQTPTIWDNVGPRFGFAYSVNPKTVVRGGYGIMYDASPMQVANHNAGFEGFRLSNPMNISFNGLTPANYLSNPFPNGFKTPSRSPATDLGFTVDESWFPAWFNPNIQQWNLNVQRQLPGNVVVEAGYIGNKGTHIIDGDTTPFNQVDPKYLSLGSHLYDSVPNPFYGVITDPQSPLSQPMVQRRQLLRPYPQLTGLNLMWRPTGSSIYHAFTLRAEKRFSRGLGFLVAFTGGKLISDSEDSGFFSTGGGNAVQNTYDRRAERAVSNEDVPRRLVISAVYELPVGHGHRFLGNSNNVLNGILGGWQVNTITTLQKGQPIPLSQITNDTGLFNATQRPNYSGGPVRYTKGSESARIQHWFDASSFLIAPPFTFGNAPRNLTQVREPGIANADVSLFKNFHVAERLTAQFRLEAFNALNKTQFGRVNGVIGSGIEGQITDVAIPPRQLQLGLKLIF